MNQDIQIRPYRTDDLHEVVKLWGSCELVRPWNDPKKDIERKLRVNPDWFLVALFEQQLIGTVMAGYEGHRGWINYLAVAADFRRQGVGRQLMETAERILRDAGCAKINLLVRVENNPALSRFYENLGFRLDNVVCYGKRLEEDAFGLTAKRL